MKKKTIHLNIPTPCHENWNEMSSVEQGRFCKLCDKNVIDFTKMSDREIIKVLETNESVCGRLTEEQLNKPIYQASNYKPASFPLPQLLFGFLALTSPVFVYAQNTIQTEMVHEDEPVTVRIIIEGIVIDSSNMEPASFCQIMLVTKEDKLLITTTTDFDGSFKIELNAITPDEYIYIKFDNHSAEVFTETINVRSDLPVKRNFYLKKNKLIYEVGLIVVDKKAIRKRRPVKMGKVNIKKFNSKKEL